MSIAQDSGDIAAAADPIQHFKDWFAEAKAQEPVDPDAMALATVDASGLPNVRMVLLKDVTERGFVFYTNLESAKGEELAGNPKAALCFHWKSIGRQVRVRGAVERVMEAEADAYFKSRPKDSQIGAWASRQSRPVEGRFALEREVAKFGAIYAFQPVPRPGYWSGFRVQPLSIEFWRAGLFRLHTRLVYRRDSPDAPWTTERLFP